MAENSITYRNHITQADKKRAALGLNNFKGMNKFEMKDVVKRKLKINILNYKEKYQCYDIIKAWVEDESNSEYIMH